MGVGDGPHDGQAQPAAAWPAVGLAVREALEEPVDVVVGQSRTLIGHGDLQPAAAVAVGAGGDGEGQGAVAVLQPVAGEVAGGLTHALDVERGRAAGPEVEPPAARGHGLDVVEQGAGQLGDLDVRGGVGEVAPFGLGEGLEVVEDPLQLGDLGALLEDGAGGRLAGQARVHDGQGAGDLLVGAQDELGLAVEGLLEAVQHAVELLGQAGDVVAALDGQAAVEVLGGDGGGRGAQVAQGPQDLAGHEQPDDSGEDQDRRADADHEPDRGVDLVHARGGEAHGDDGQVLGGVVGLELDPGPADLPAAVVGGARRRLQHLHEQGVRAGQVQGRGGGAGGLGGLAGGVVVDDDGLPVGELLAVPVDLHEAGGGGEGLGGARVDAGGGEVLQLLDLMGDVGVGGARDVRHEGGAHGDDHAGQPQGDDEQHPGDDAQPGGHRGAGDRVGGRRGRR